MRKVSGRRLFQSDGYTFVRWIDEEEVVNMMDSGEIRICIDPRTGRAIGFRLNAKLSERVTSIASLLPGRTYDPMMQPPSLNYEIPHAGDRGIFARHRRKFIRVSARKIDFASAYSKPVRSGANLPIRNVSSSLNSTVRSA